jgi:hypothetical protein
LTSQIDLVIIALQLGLNWLRHAGTCKEKDTNREKRHAGLIPGTWNWVGMIFKKEAESRMFGITAN